jgi:hypothetical protein
MASGIRADTPQAGAVGLLKAGVTTFLTPCSSRPPVLHNSCPFENDFGELEPHQAEGVLSTWDLSSRRARRLGPPFEVAPFQFLRLADAPIRVSGSPGTRRILIRLESGIVISPLRNHSGASLA